MLRLAWFSPLPPVRSGIADLNARLLPRLDERFAIDRYDAGAAHDFVWTHRRRPYDLVVYQLGNAACHDYMWGYLARYPGLVVLHDPRLHHARARLLLQSGRADDYRREFRFDHPDAVPDFVEYAVAGLGGPIYYLWPMLRAVVRSARVVAVHNARVAADLREAYPGSRVETVRLGTPPSPDDDGAGARVRAALGIEAAAVVFTAFGTLTAEKRIDAVVRAFTTLAAERADVHLVLAGDASGLALDRMVAAAPAARVHVTGYLPDDAVAGHLAAADVGLCLRWPTALETSASWLQCLAAGRATIVSDLAHLVDVPTIDPRAAPGAAEGAAVAMRVDLLDEDAALLAAMRALAGDEALRRRLGGAGRAYWSRHHTLDAMADDYLRVVIAATAAEPPRRADDLPSHFTDDHTSTARALARRFGLEPDILR
jgi:glycosyltransferase involved in cell wall biosynthesis